jgi:hypothetical protein
MFGEARPRPLYGAAIALPELFHKSLHHFTSVRAIPFPLALHGVSQKLKINGGNAPELIFMNTMPVSD